MVNSQLRLSFFKDTKGSNLAVISGFSCPLTSQFDKSPCDATFFVFLGLIASSLHRQLIPLFRPKLMLTCITARLLTSLPFSIFTPNTGRNFVRCKLNWYTSTFIFQWLPITSEIKWVRLSFLWPLNTSLTWSPTIWFHAPCDPVKMRDLLLPKVTGDTSPGNSAHVEPTAQHSRPFYLAKFFFLQKWRLKCHFLWEVLCDSFSQELFLWHWVYINQSTHHPLS